MEKVQLPPIDKHGSCPNCEYGWDGGDILETVSQLSVFIGKEPHEIKRIAADCYGYTENNKTRFTNLKQIEIPVEDISVWQCPRCNHVWDKVTNHHYKSLGQLRDINNNIENEIL